MSQEALERGQFLYRRAPHAADPALDAALAANKAAGLPAIDVSPPQGKLLNFFARMIGARRVLEIGTLGGYSTIWLARALPPEGVVVTLEALPAHADVARKNIERAGLTARVDLRVGPALESLPLLRAKAPLPSTWFSWTPTSAATRTIWSGR